MATCLCPSLIVTFHAWKWQLLHLTLLSSLERFCFHPEWAPPTHLNQTGSPSCSCTYFNRSPPEWQLERHPSTAPCTENTQHSPGCMADSADIEATVLLDLNHCILWTVSRQISSKHGLMPKLQSLRLKKLSISLPVRLTLSQAALSFQPSVSISSVQIPATATNTGSTDPLLLQHFRTAHSPQVTQTCKEKQKP